VERNNNIYYNERNYDNNFIEIQILREYFVDADGNDCNGMS